MSKVKITLDQKPVELDKGLTAIESLYENINLKPDDKRLYLDKLGDIDVPLLPNEYIIIDGGENLFVGDINDEIENNPLVRKPIGFKFNDKTIEPGLQRAKVNSDEITYRDEELAAPRLFVDVLGAADSLVPDDITLVVQDSDSYFTIPTSDGGLVDLEACAETGRRPPRGQKNYGIKIDKELYKVETQKMSGRAVVALVGKNYVEWSLNQKLHGGRRKPIEAEEIIDFAQQGIERFETVMKQAQQG